MEYRKLESLFIFFFPLLLSIPLIRSFSSISFSFFFFFFFDTHQWSTESIWKLNVHSFRIPNTTLSRFSISFLVHAAKSKAARCKKSTCKNEKKKKKRNEGRYSFHIHFISGEYIFFLFIFTVYAYAYIQIFVELL